MERWNGKIAVVTGASFGIGEELARSLDKFGLKVIALARSKDKLINLAKSSQGRIVPMSCDVQHEKQVMDVFKKIENDFGGVDILVNNAGVFSKPASIDCPANEFKNVLDTNLVGLNVCTTQALKTMRKRGDNGQIIHVNSILGHEIHTYPSGKIGVYPATKHALTALANIHRYELRYLGSRIKVTSISPGLVTTKLAKTAFSTLYEKDDYEFNSRRTKGYLLPSDVSDAVISVLKLPPHVEIRELILTADEYTDDPSS